MAEAWNWAGHKDESKNLVTELGQAKPIPEKGSTFIFKIYRSSLLVRNDE